MLLRATNRPLADLVRDGEFRADLYYRLQVLTIALPPLRERRAEIESLARALAPAGARISAAAMRAMEGYNWPGNVRELKNTLWRAAILADQSPILPAHLGLARPVSATPGVDYSLAAAEEGAIRAALDATSGNKVKAAELLGIARSTLQEKLKRFDFP